MQGYRAQRKGWDDPKTSDTLKSLMDEAERKGEEDPQLFVEYEMWMRKLNNYLIVLKSLDKGLQGMKENDRFQCAHPLTVDLWALEEKKQIRTLRDLIDKYPSPKPTEPIRSEAQSREI